MKVKLNIYEVRVKCWVAAQDPAEAIANCFNATGIVGQAMVGTPVQRHDFEINLEEEFDGPAAEKTA